MTVWFAGRPRSLSACAERITPGFSSLKVSPTSGYTPANLKYEGRTIRVIGMMPGAPPAIDNSPENSATGLTLSTLSLVFISSIFARSIPLPLSEGYDASRVMRESSLVMSRPIKMYWSPYPSDTRKTTVPIPTDMPRMVRIVRVGLVRKTRSESLRRSHVERLWSVCTWSFSGAFDVASGF